MKAVIPAAGLGTRFLPITKAQPKEMLPVFDKPTIQYVVEEVVASGIDNILIITGRGKRAIEDHFDKSTELEMVLKNSAKEEYLRQMEEISDLADIHYVRQKEQRGLGDAIYCARKIAGYESLAVVLGDTIAITEDECTRQLMNIFEEYNSSVIAVEKVARDKLESYGIIKCTPIDSIYEVEDLVEKPKPEDAPSDLGIIGRYVLTPEIFDAMKRVAPGVGGEIQLTDALKLLLNDQKIYASEFEGKRYDIGNKLDWLKSSIEFALQNDDVKEDLIECLDNICKK